MESSDEDFVSGKKNVSNLRHPPDKKKKQPGRPKGSKNKVKSSRKRKTVENPTEVQDVKGPLHQEPLPLLLVPKIVLKINVSKGTVKGGDEFSPTTAVHPKKRCKNYKTKLDTLKSSDIIPTSQGLPLPNLPKSHITASNILAQESVKRDLFNSPSDSETLLNNEDLAIKLKKSDTRSKLLKLFIPPDVVEPGLTSGAPCNSGVSIGDASNEHAQKAQRLQKRFKSVKKSPKKRKRRAKYYTLKPEIVDDNSGRSSGSSSCSDQALEWQKRTYPTESVRKQMDFLDSTPDKGKRQPSSSPPTSPECNISAKRPTTPGSFLNLDSCVKNMNWEPTQPPDATLPHGTKFKAQVEEFFREYLPTNLPSSFKTSTEMPRFPVVHEANCCAQWRKRSAARGKQPAGPGTRKRKGVCTGYLVCPCQYGAGPSSAMTVLPSFDKMSSLLAVGSQPFGHAQPSSVGAASTSATSGTDPRIIKFGNDELVSDIKLQPGKVFAIMDLSDDSDVDRESLKSSTIISCPLPEKVIKTENPSSPRLTRQCSNSSDSSDVEFVPGPPIEEIIVSDESNDIIFVSETASPNKTSATCSNPKKEEPNRSTESADIIFDFASNPASTSPHAAFLRKKLPVPALVHSSSNDILKAEAELLSNPICALPPAENFVTTFDTTLESLYPAYSKNAGRTPEPLDFDALLDFEAETMTTQNYEPYSPCLPDPPSDDYDRSNEIINIDSPERPVIPEPVPEKNDGLVVWECPVCFEPKGDETILATTDCTHLFCDPCIRKVASIYGKCPVCQCAIKENNIHPFRFHGYKF